MLTPPWAKYRSRSFTRISSAEETTWTEKVPAASSQTSVPRGYFSLNQPEPYAPAAPLTGLSPFTAIDKTASR
ncbi:hypothetical protein D1872_322680 [compost metagenome]